MYIRPSRYLHNYPKGLCVGSKDLYIREKVVTHIESDVTGKNDKKDHQVSSD